MALTSPLTAEWNSAEAGSCEMNVIQCYSLEFLDELSPVAMHVCISLFINSAYYIYLFFVSFL